MSEQPTAVGIDLAWADRHPTGVCVAVGDRIVESGTRSTDDEIIKFIRPWLSPSTIVAVDAPLVVPNFTGQRRAERLVGTLFGAAGGSAHSANRSRPGFEDGGRAAALAAELGLSVDPAGALPVMIEVYPHPALIAQFGLDQVMAYKAKAGRPLEYRRGVFEILLDHLETLANEDPPLDVTTSPRWSAIRNGIATVARPVDLDLLEDEIDAYVCAYVGLHRIRWGGERSAVLGSVDEGYIVTPLDPERMAWFRAHEEGSRPPSRPSHRGHEAKVLATFQAWLKDQGWRIVQEATSRADLIAERDGERMVGEAKGFTGANAGLDIDTLYGQLLRRMDTDPATTWAVIVPSQAVTHALRVPRIVRQQLGIVVYEVADDGVRVHDD